MRETHPRAKRLLTGAVSLFFFSAFLLLALRDYAWQGFVLAVAVPLCIRLSVDLLPRLFPTDSLLLSLTGFLSGLGVLVLYATEPTRAYHQAAYYGIGLVCMIVCVYAIRLLRKWAVTSLILYPISLTLLAVPLLIGKETYGATNWVYVGGISLQPSEVVKLSLIIICARYMSRQRFLPWFLFSLASLGLLMLQKDLGTALLYYTVTLLMYFAASGHPAVLLLGLAGGAGSAVAGYQMFAHVKKRVAIWRNPWADYDNAGYQIVQSLMAIASGGLFGVGLGLGSPKTIPVYHTDFIFSVICEQFGILFGLCVLAVYAAIIWRGTTIAMAARTRFHGLVAMGATLMLGLQTFVIIGGVIKLIPLTGVTLPFVSYGGTSMLASLCLTGLIQGVASVNADELENDRRLAEIGEKESRRSAGTAPLTGNKGR